jgi:hypothetical protein
MRDLCDIGFLPESLVKQRRNVMSPISRRIIPTRCRS